MDSSPSPPAGPAADAHALHALDPATRRLISALLASPGSLVDLAAQVGTDIVALAERMLAPDVQAALAAIERAAAQLARLQAVLHAPIALAALTRAAAPISNASPSDCRRAAGALLRAASARTPGPPGPPAHSIARPRAAVHPAQAPPMDGPIRTSISEFAHAPEPPAARTINAAPTRSRDRPLTAAA